MSHDPAQTTLPRTAPSPPWVTGCHVSLLSPCWPATLRTPVWLPPHGPRLPEGPVSGSEPLWPVPVLHEASLSPSVGLGGQAHQYPPAQQGVAVSRPTAASPANPAEAHTVGA